MGGFRILQDTKKCDDSRQLQYEGCLQDLRVGVARFDKHRAGSKFREIFRNLDRPQLVFRPSVGTRLYCRRIDCLIVAHIISPYADECSASIVLYLFFCEIKNGTEIPSR